MAVKYLDSKRIRGSSTGANTITFQDEFDGTDDWVDNDSSKLGVNTSNDNIDFNCIDDGSNDAMVYDLTSVSDSKWNLRCEVTFSDIDRGEHCFLYIGLSDGNQTEGEQTPQNFMGVRLMTPNNATRRYDAIDMINDDLEPQNTQLNQYYTFLESTIYYVEIARTSSIEYTVEIFTGSFGGTSLGKLTSPCLASLTGLRWIKFANRHGAGSGGGNYIGTIDNVTFYNGLSGTTQDEKATLVTSLDSLGSAADATNSGAVVDDATAIYGQKSLIFTDDTVNLGNDLDAITSEFTFTCWAYFASATASGHKTIISKPAAGNWTGNLYHSFTVQHASGSTNVELVVNDGSTYQAITVASGGVGWHFITVTKTGNVFVLKVDDNLSATMTHSVTWGTQDWVIGETPFESSSRYWDGKIQDVAFWSRVLTGAEQTVLYGTKSGAGNAGSSSETGVVATGISMTGLKAYYTFNDATTGVTNTAPTASSDLPTNTIFEETDTYSTHWLQTLDGKLGWYWTYQTDFSADGGYTQVGSQVVHDFTTNNRVVYTNAKDDWIWKLLPVPIQGGEDWSIKVKWTHTSTSASGGDYSLIYLSNSASDPESSGVKSLGLKFAPASTNIRVRANDESTKTQGAGAGGSYEATDNWIHLYRQNDTLYVQLYTESTFTTTRGDLVSLAIPNNIKDIKLTHLSFGADSADVSTFTGSMDDLVVCNSPHGVVG